MHVKRKTEFFLEMLFDFQFENFALDEGRKHQTHNIHEQRMGTAKKSFSVKIPLGPGNESSMGGILTIIGGRCWSTQMPMLKQMYRKNTKHTEKMPRRMRPHRSWWNLRELSRRLVAMPMRGAREPTPSEAKFTVLPKSSSTCLAVVGGSVAIAGRNGSIGESKYGSSSLSSLSRVRLLLSVA